MQLIVGDKFSSFANAAGALTCSDAVQALFSRDISTPLAMGQGLSDDDLKLLALLSDARGLKVVPLAGGRKRADQSITHKHIPANGLISTPVRVADQVLQADLLVDDANEIMSDHLTGCHIQGMILIEAIRQMFVAAAQLHESTWTMSSTAVVIQKIDISFENFAFPVATIIRHSTLAADTAQKERTAFKALVEIEQNGNRCCVAQVEYLAIDAALLEPKEVLKAKRSARTFLREIAADTESGAVLAAADAA